MPVSDDERVMRAIANECRRKMLEHLFDVGACGYTELMRAAGFGIGESGRFAYHLRRLIDAGLVKQLPDGRYGLTPKGRQVAAMVREESVDPPTIIDVLEEFSKSTNVSGFMRGSVLTFTGLGLAITGACLTVASLLNMPAKIEIMGNAHYVMPNAVWSVLSLAAGVLVLWAGIGTLKQAIPRASVLELLVYQKYSFLLMSRSGMLGKYLLMCVLGALLWVGLTLASFLIH